MKTFLSSRWFLWPTLIVNMAALFNTYRTHDWVWTALFTVNLCTCIDAIRKLPKRAKPSGKETPCAASGMSAGAPLTVGNFGDSTEAQLRRELANVPLPNYIADPMSAQELADRVRAGEKWKLAETVVPTGGGRAGENPAARRASAASGVLVGAPLTDEQIEAIWNSLGYRTRFAPYMLRLVHAVLSHTSDKDAATLATIRAAVNGYYFALVKRQHGNVAQTEAFDKIEQALDMHESKGKN